MNRRRKEKKNMKKRIEGADMCAVEAVQEVDAKVAAEGACWVVLQL